jgi:hypothetical protein
MYMDERWIPVTGIIFGCAIPIVAIIFEHFTKKSKMRVIEKAIENGISPEDLSLEGKKGPRVPYRSGMIALAVGLGIGIFSFVIGKMQMDAFYPLLGTASIPILVGIALIINDRINYERLFNKEPDTK